VLVQYDTVMLKHMTTYPAPLVPSNKATSGKPLTCATFSTVDYPLSLPVIAIGAGAGAGLFCSLLSLPEPTPSSPPLTSS